MMYLFSKFQLFGKCSRMATQYGHIFLKKNYSVDLKKTCLNNFHISRGGKMVDFAGFSMPLQYAESIPDSHKFVRASAGLFDVSHMLQLKISGSDRLSFMESLTVADLKSLPANNGTLSLFTNDKGGIEDDLIVNNINDEYLYVVLNAACAEKDYNYIVENIKRYKLKGFDVNVDILDRGLLALQGPLSSRILQPLVKSVNLDSLFFMRSANTSVLSVDDCMITRCGYTGEDGFEISVPLEKTEFIAETLLDSDYVKPIGLGARDSLRIEAGLCLYGTDIDETTSPIEAGLAWTIGKRRRLEGGFPGYDVIRHQLKEGVDKKRVGIICGNGPLAKFNAPVFNMKGDEIGHVTSGVRSPSYGSNSNIAYVSKAESKVGREVQLKIRGKMYKAKVAKLPFLKCNYYVPKK